MIYFLEHLNTFNVVQYTQLNELILLVKNGKIDNTAVTRVIIVYLQQRFRNISPQ